MPVMPHKHALSTVTHPVLQVFAYPFRIFFLSMAVLAVLLVPLWVLVIGGHAALPLALPALIWHQHEMLFGFLSAAIAGFLLTAVCVWTQTERLHGAQLMMLWSVWLLGRVLLLLGGEFPVWLVQGVNLAFLPLVMLDAGRRVVGTRQPRQYPILAVLGALWIMQCGLVLQGDVRYSQGALIMALALISIIGGRITPAFSANWLRQQGRDGSLVAMRPVLDRANLILLILLMGSLVVSVAWFSGLLAVAAAFVMGVRLSGWRGWLFASEPLLWVLHLSLWWVPVSLLLLAGAQWWDWPATLWTHAAGTGAVGCLIVGVIARVALGHTGRPLQLPSGMVLAFVAVHLAALCRVTTAAGWIPWQAGVWLSSGLWMLAFGLFLWRYAGILCQPRADGRPG